MLQMFPKVFLQWQRKKIVIIIFLAKENSSIIIIEYECVLIKIKS